jgi:hypothetical protein
MLDIRNPKGKWLRNLIVDQIDLDDVGFVGDHPDSVDLSFALHQAFHFVHQNVFAQSVP